MTVTTNPTKTQQPRSSTRRLASATDPGRRPQRMPRSTTRVIWTRSDVMVEYGEIA